MSPIYLFVGVLVLTVLHEFGHIISAWILRLKIFSVGIAPLPYPHPYVKVAHTPIEWKKRVFFYAGAGMTLVLFVIAYLFGLLDYRLIYFAFVIELLIEFNPFYSDFILVEARNPREFYMFNTNFRGSKKYLLFFWILLFLVLLHPKGLQSWLALSI